MFAAALLPRLFSYSAQLLTKGAMRKYTLLVMGALLLTLMSGSNCKDTIINGPRKSSNSGPNIDPRDYYADSGNEGDCFDN